MRRVRNACGIWIDDVKTADEAWKYLEQDNDSSVEEQSLKVMGVEEEGTERPALHSWLVLQRRCMSCHI